MIIKNLQLEEGLVATPFEQRPYGLELSLCQRYFQTSYTNGSLIGTAVADNTNEVRGWGDGGGAISGAGARFQTTMRPMPTVVVYDRAGNANKISTVNGGGTTADNVVINSTKVNIDGISARAYGGTVYETVFHYTASAEL